MGWPSTANIGSQNRGIGGNMDPILGFLGGLGGGFMNLLGGFQQQDFSARQAQINREFESGQANRMMEFQERMSSTAHQREVEDLRKAGLNPILSASGGASAPSGGMAGGSMPQSNSITEDVATTALEGMRLSQDMKQKEADIEATKAIKDRTEQEAKYTKTKDEVLNLQKKGEEANAVIAERKKYSYKKAPWFWNTLDEMRKWIPFLNNAKLLRLGD